MKITAGPGGFVCEWNHKPGPWLNKAELATYKAARQDILQKVAMRIGGTVLVVDGPALSA